MINKLLVSVLIVVIMVTSSCSSELDAELVKYSAQTIEEASVVGKWDITEFIGSDTAKIPPLASLLMTCFENDLNRYEFNLKNFIIKSKYDDSIYSVRAYSLSNDGKVLVIQNEDGGKDERMLVSALADEGFTVEGEGYKLKFQRTDR